MLECGRRFTTSETMVLAVVKRSGVTEQFSRDKVVRGVRRACQEGPSTTTRCSSWRSGSRSRSGRRASPRSRATKWGSRSRLLRELDGVAYLRFASVYRSFTSVEDFEKEIADLRTAMAGAPAPDDPAAAEGEESKPGE